MDPKRLLLHMTKQLYDDIKFVTEQNPTQIVDDDGVVCYNSLLNKARKYFPYDEFIGDFGDWQPRSIKYKDALIVVGQLCSMIGAFMESGADMGSRDQVRRPVTPAPSLSHSPHQRPSVPSRQPSVGHSSAGTSPSSTQHRMLSRPTPPAASAIPDEMTPQPIQRPGIPQEPKRPGAKPDKDLYGSDPVIRNDDGTIPFTLD